MAAIRPPRTPMSRSARPSWLTTVPPLRIRSKVWGMAIYPLRPEAIRAYVTLLMQR